jgi:site-specific recombinase XerD
MFTFAAKKNGTIMQDYPIIQEFMDYLSYERHFSSHTIKCYSAAFPERLWS